jgi:molybdenum cofactor cytidylyltransferase
MNAIKVCAIYLAAGQSRRMGENKLALPLRKTTIGSLALRAALESDLDHIFVVSKKEDNLDWMEPFFFLSHFQAKWTHIRCVNAELGQAYSLKCGLMSALKRNPDGIMVILADQPFVPVTTINELISVAEYVIQNKMDEKINYIAAGFQGVPRPPVLFFRAILPLLLELKGDEGARQLFRKSSLKGILHEIHEKIAFFDIDTKEDYDKAVNCELKNDRL